MTGTSTVADPNIVAMLDRLNDVISSIGSATVAIIVGTSIIALLFKFGK